MRVLVGSTNPVKIQGAKEAFEVYFNNFQISGVSVQSDVSDQPFNEEIYTGAKNRVLNLIKYSKEYNVEADYFVAIESGVTNYFGKWININVAVIIDKNGYESIGTSQGFPIPDKYISEIKEKGLGCVMDKLSNIDNIAKKFGGVYYITQGKVSRSEISKSAFIMALTQFINGKTWHD